MQENALELRALRGPVAGMRLGLLISEAIRLTGVLVGDAQGRLGGNTPAGQAAPADAPGSGLDPATCRGA
jgi:hypothetical protein